MEDEIAYQEALDYLYSFIDYSLTRSFRYSPEKFDLSRMRALVERLGNPQAQYPKIHVAGTKGKGSVSALTANALRAAGYRVGLYTSPHLQDYTERIQIDGINIPHSELAALVDEIKPHVAQIEHLTTFELTTALAFLYFARKNVTAAVIEVGLGGRLDATNVIDPEVSVITALSYDHMNVLGNTLTQIAGEKAGIIKQGKPVVSSPQKEEALRVIERVASERSAPLSLVGRDMLYRPLTHSLDGQSFLVWPAHGGNQQALELEIPLLGAHQVENAVTAYSALTLLREAGFRVSDEAIRKGFAQVVWPARFEILRRDPPVVIDSAHNPDSAARLSQTIEDYLPEKPVILVFGASEDKDVDGMFDHLLPHVKKVIATQSVHPRAMETEKIVHLAEKHGRPAEAIMPLEAALTHALQEAGRDTAVVVTGSLFVAAAAQFAWQHMEPRPIVSGD